MSAFCENVNVGGTGCLNCVETVTNFCKAIYLLDI